MTLYRRHPHTMVQPRTDPHPGENFRYPGEWVRDAACADSNPELWFPGSGDNAWFAKSKCLGPRTPGGGPHDRDTTQACPVRDHCLTYALSLPRDETQGIWGGLTERERVNLKRRGAA